MLSTTGPYGLPALFWKKAAAGVAFPLSVIFSNSYKSSTFPDEWRLATVRLFRYLKKAVHQTQITIDLSL